jgi:hypothetical protein
MNNSMKVYVVDEKAIHVHEILGLSEEGCIKIGKKIAEKMREETGIAADLSAISEVCENPQELAFASYAYAKTVYEKKAQLEKLKQLLSPMIKSMRNSSEMVEFLEEMGKEHDCENCEKNNDCELKKLFSK